VRAVGFGAIPAAAAMIVGGVTVWGIVTSQLRAEKISVADDAPFLSGARVQGPLSAYAQATIINRHALSASKGKTFAELPQDDPIRGTVMNASFLRASLFTSVVSYGVSAFAIGMGAIVGLFGWVIITVVPAGNRR
jgi:hypothetical protein